MIQETEMWYVTEWIDDECELAERYLGGSMTEAIEKAHNIRDEEGISPFIIDVRKTKTVVMQVRK